MAASISVTYRYAPTPAPVADDTRHYLPWPLDGQRGEAQVQAKLLDPVLVRDALLTVGDILASDLRFKARDRADYLAYLLAHGKRASKAVWEAQRAFLDAQYQEVGTEAPLDPLLSVAADGLSIEVFSRDESTYARLHLKAGAAYTADNMVPGSSHLPLTPELLSALGQIRSHRATTLDFQPSTTGTERSTQVPYRWLRAFGQVQAAATLPAERAELTPVDLYNVLWQLRLHKAKKAPRALRFELVPGQAPRLVLEPWETVITATGPAYQGSRPHVVRTWGRQRLLLLARLLPHAKAVHLHLLGAGLPAFYVIDLGAATLTLALSGWTDSGWAGIAAFDLLAPGAVDELLARRVLNSLQQQPATLNELAHTLEQPRQNLRAALLSELLKGTLAHDIANGRFHYRPLTAMPLDAEQLRYRDANEEQAHRLLAVASQVQLTRIHDLGADGVSIDGDVEDKQAHRHYQPSFTLDREGRSVKAHCTCPQARRSGLKEGPCPHMIALRVAYARQQAELERARETPEGRQLIRAETRTLLRRERDGAEIYRLSLDDRQVTLRWGRGHEANRQQRLYFASADAARADYFARLDTLAGKGFIDASGAE